jgi:hypothetical protein
LRVEHDWRENGCAMRVILGFLSLIATAAICIGGYYYFLKQTVPSGTNAPITSAIQTTGVEMDLNAIAQAERTYYTSNGVYATFEQLVSSGDLTMTKPGRDDYTYTVDANGNGFTVTAKWTPPPNAPATLHYPTMIVDQTMQVRQAVQ